MERLDGNAEASTDLDACLRGLGGRGRELEGEDHSLDLSREGGYQEDRLYFGSRAEI